ncbi:MAG: hypothetical protein U0821_24715 [Chloroflexota bacterium]
MAGLRGLRIAFLDRPHPAGYQGALADELVPMLRDAGGRVELVHAECGLHRVDRDPGFDMVVLKSGSAAALHLAAVAEAWGARVINACEATRLAQDKISVSAILQQAGLPIATGHAAWLPLARPEETAKLAGLARCSMIVKAARGSRGVGLWRAEPGELLELLPSLPEAPYLLMDHVPHSGEDLKVFAAGDWLAAVARPFPANTLEEKLGQPVEVPAGVACTVREVGRLLGLTCFGCDFVRGTDGWVLVDVNAFPGYKGASGAAVAICVAIERSAVGVRA